MFTDLLQVDIKWLYPVKSDYIDKGHLKIGPVSDKNYIFRKTYLSKLKDIFVPLRRIVVGGKYFQDHSLKAVTSCENSLKGEIKGIFNIDGLLG